MPGWGAKAYRAHVAPALEGADGLAVALDAGDRAWTVRVEDGAVRIEDGIAAGAQALARGTAGEVVLWLWRRAPVDALRIEGERGKAAALHGLVGAFAQ